MKKIFYIFCLSLFILSPIHRTQAEGEPAQSCLIKSKTAPVLDNYVKDVRKVIKNINKDLLKGEKKDVDQSVAQKKFIKAYNKIVDWNLYTSTFEYYVTFPISNEIPYEINRDHKLLKSELKSLEEYLEKVISRGYSDATVANVCEGVEYDKNCVGSGKAVELITALMKNTNSVADMYREAVISKKVIKNQKLQLVDTEKFHTLLQKNYGDNALMLCSQEEGGFAQRMEESIERIQSTFEEGQDGVKIWQEAIALANGIDTPKEEAAERNILARELSRQGVSLENSKAMMKNLEDYNAGTTGVDNYIGNTFRGLKDSLTEDFNGFGETISSFFGANNETKTPPESVAINNIETTKFKKEITENIKKNVAANYQSEIPFALLQDTNSEKLRNNVLKVHDNIYRGIFSLEEACPIAAIVCNSQDKGSGNCSCNR